MSITNNKARPRAKPLLFGALIIAAPLAVGGVHFGVALSLLFLSILYWGVGQIDRGDRPLVVPLPVAAFALFALVCVLQLIPLPGVFHGVLDPRGWELYSQGAALLGVSAEQLRWHPLSLAPAETVDRALRWVVLGVVGVAAADFATRKGAWPFTLRAVVAAGLVQLVVGAAQLLAGSEKVLFLYEPTAGSLDGFTTFVNTNQAAVFYGLASLAALALCIHAYHRSRVEASVAAVLGVVFMIAMNEHDSHGASLAYWMSLVAMIVALLARTLPSGRAVEFLERRFFSVALAGAMAVPAAIGAALWWGPLGLREWLETTAFGEWLYGKALVRLELARAAFEGALAHPWTGTGAGATGSALRPFIDWEIVPPASVPTVENEPVEWLFTMGFPVAIGAGLLLLAGFAIVVAMYRARRRRRLMAVFAIALFLLLNAQFHFPFFALGLGVPFVALIVVGLVSAERSEEKPRGFFRLRPGAGRALRVAVLLAAVGLGALFYAVFDVSGEEAGADAPTQVAAEQWLQPAEGLVFVRQASDALARGEPDVAVELIEHAYRLDPRLTVAAARAHVLARAGDRERAIDAYRAVFANPALVKRGVVRGWAERHLLGDFLTAEQRAYVLHEASAEHWGRVFGLILRQDGPPAATLFALALADELPDEYALQRLIVRGYIRQGEHQLAELWARSFLIDDQAAAGGADATGYALLLNAIRKQGRTDDAVALVAQRADLLEQDQDFWREATNLLTSTTRQAPDDFIAAIERGHGSWCAGVLDRRERRRCWHAEAWLAEQAGELQEAEWAYRRIFDDSQNPRLLLDFYSRHFRCAKIEALMHEWREEQAGGDDRWRTRFERAKRACERKP